MPEQSVKCPRCGQRVAVPTTGEKVLCPGCGQKFRFEAPRPAAPPPLPPGPAPPQDELDLEDTPPPQGTREVRCPECGKGVQVPVNGEKAFCGCGRKFRFEAPAEKAAASPGVTPPPLAPPETKPTQPPPLAAVSSDEAPTPPPETPPVAVNEVTCPRCNGRVKVPLSGEKVRCPGCGQKFRLDVTVPLPRPAPPDLPGIASPGAVLAAATAAAACPAPEPPRPSATPPTPEAAGELRVLWPAVRRAIHEAYESGRVTDDARVSFREKADRVATLANGLLGPPGPASSVGHVFITSVLPELTLDETFRLSLEDYRHLDESLDDVQRVLDERLAKAAPAPAAVVLPKPVLVGAPGEAAAPPAPRRRKGLSTFEAVAAVVSVAALAAVVVFFPEIQEFAHKLQGGIQPAPKIEPPPDPGTANAIPPFPEPPKTGTKTGRPTRVRTPASPKAATGLAVHIPEFRQPESPKVQTSIVVVPPEKVEPPEPKEEPEPPVPKDVPEPPTPESPWARLGPGAHRLFNGTDLKDWVQAGAWEVRNGCLVGRAAVGPVASAVAGSPEWADYTLRARCRIVRADRVTREGEYYLLIVRYQDPGNFYCVRFPIEGIYEIGYYRNGAFREIGRARHGLGSRFNQWHEIEVGIRGDQLSVVIDNIRTGAPPWSLRGLDRGPAGVGVTGGQAEFDNIRIRVER
ncbi:MAG TPA: DUF1080 domain-containing protein [Planctomycetota bacterium]|nr:DUF1080 domain-containing protein [Planctomycetota bacterium]HRR80206.1 DUF1080 domain-containing protein [Planctomycetota bacterium]HRT93202.1 DUF1080 domain-containing protein [Planctomycetota bacterium]